MAVMMAKKLTMNIFIWSCHYHNPCYDDSDYYDEGHDVDDDKDDDENDDNEDDDGEDWWTMWYKRDK